MEEGCTLDVKKYVADSMVVLPAGTMVGRQSLRDLRKQKDVVIPEGVQEIGEQWFKCTEI